MICFSVCCSVLAPYVGSPTESSWRKEGATGRRFSCPLFVVNYKKRLRLSFRIHWTCLRWASPASCSARGNLKVGASSMLQGVNKVGDLSEMPWLILGFFGRFSPRLIVILNVELLKHQSLWPWEGLADVNVVCEWFLLFGRFLKVKEKLFLLLKQHNSLSFAGNN